MPDLLFVASIMVCYMPRYLNGRLIISSCDTAWHAVDKLPEELRPYFTDELGNSVVYYGGFLQILDPNVLSLLSNYGLFACFRCVSKSNLEHMQTRPPESLYQHLMPHLNFMGWDIVTGNGWLSASCHGCFPIDPFTGNAKDRNAGNINEYGLFGAFDDCLKYCQANDKLIPEHAPWLPVAVYVDRSSYKRLNAYLNAMRLTESLRKFGKNGAENRLYTTNIELALQAGKDFLDQEDYEAAFSALLPCAEEGLVDAEAAVGALYMLGVGTPRNLEKAVMYLKRAVDKGSGVSANNLATLYVTCEPDMPSNPEESRRWLRIAADMGFVPGGENGNP